MKLRRRPAVSRPMKGDTHTRMQRWIDEAEAGNVRRFAEGANITPSTIYRGMSTKGHDFKPAVMDLAEAYHRAKMIERAAAEAARAAAATATATAETAAPDREMLELAIRAAQDIGLPLTSPLLAFLASGTYRAIARMRARGVPLEGEHALEVARSVAEELIDSYPGGDLDQPQTE